MTRRIGTYGQTRHHEELGALTLMVMDYLKREVRPGDTVDVKYKQSKDGALWVATIVISFDQQKYPFGKGPQ